MKFNLKEGDTILLYQFMKASGLYDDYSQIRHEIRKGNVSVNNQVTINQREEIKIGDEVRHRENHYKIVVRPPLPPGQKEDQSGNGRDFKNRRRTEHTEENSNEPATAEIPAAEKRIQNIKHGRVNKWKSAPLKIEENINHNLDEISRKVHQLLMDSGLTISLAESCTGGMVQAMLTTHSGSSVYFSGGVVSYSNEAKRSVLHVRKNLLNKYGAVSEEVAASMVKGVQKLFDTDIAAAVTGIAGPTGGTKEKPVGTVYISIIFKGQVTYRRLNLGGDRDLIRRKSSLEMFKLIKETISS